MGSITDGILCLGQKDCRGRFMGCTLPVKECNHCRQVAMNVPTPSSDWLFVPILELPFAASVQADEIADTVEGDHPAV